MTKGAARNFDDEEDTGEVDDTDRDTWPTRRKAARLIGVHVRTIDRMVVQKELTPHTVKGVKRFDPKELDACDSDGSELGEEIRETLALANDATKLATDHAKQLFSLVTQPSTTLLELLSKENARLTARVSELEDKQIESIDSLQKALELSDEREIRKMQATARADRMQKGIELLSQFAPLIISQISNSSNVGRILNKLTDEQLFVLNDSGVLSDEEYRLILKIRGKEPAPKAEPVPPKTEETQTQEQENNGSRNESQEPERKSNEPS